MEHATFGRFYPDMDKTNRRASDRIGKTADEYKPPNGWSHDPNRFWADSIGRNANRQNQLARGVRHTEKHNSKVNYWPTVFMAACVMISVFVDFVR